MASSSYGQRPYPDSYYEYYDLFAFGYQAPGPQRALAQHGIVETNASRERRPIYLESRALTSDPKPKKTRKYQRHEAVHIPPYYHEIQKSPNPRDTTKSVYRASNGGDWNMRPRFQSILVGHTILSDADIVALATDRALTYSEYDILPAPAISGSSNCQTFARGLVQDIENFADPPDPFTSHFTPSKSPHSQLENAPSDAFTKQHPRLTKLHRATTKIQQFTGMVKTVINDKGKEKEEITPLRPLPVR